MKHIKKTLIQAFLCLTLGLVAQLAWAQVPNTINYQGYLTDSSGTPLKGTVNVTLKFWDALTGGNTLGSQKSYTNVNVNNGVFSQNVDVSDITFDKPVFIETTVNGETLDPRQLVTSVPSSGVAKQAEQDQDTLGGLNCTTDQIAKWNGSTWVCANPGQGPKGDTGPQGIKGDTGDQGPQGLPGASSWVDESGKVTTTVNVGIGTTTPGAKLEVNGIMRFTGGRGPMCIFANACPNGWVDKGFGGYIRRNNGSCPYAAGSAYTSGWTWCHPRICCNQ